MKNRRAFTRRLWVEELEPRVVLSASFHSPVTSVNWAGFAAEVNLNSFNSDINTVSAVSASWTVPTVTGKGTAYSSIWVGIDGYDGRSNTVEQIGTDSDIVNGQPTYYAWYEMYPRESINVTTLKIKPGDSISASVTYDAKSSKYALALTNNTTKASFSITQTLASAKRSSAEWIVEAPSSGVGVLPLANFGSATITEASATIAGKAGPIDSADYTGINMVSRGVNQATLAASTPVDTTTAGKTTSSFTVNDVAPLPPPPSVSSSNHHHWWQTNMPGVRPEDGPTMPTTTSPAVDAVPAPGANGVVVPLPTGATAGSFHASAPAYTVGGGTVDPEVRGDILGDAPVDQPAGAAPMQRPQANPGSTTPNRDSAPASPAPLPLDSQVQGENAPVVFTAESTDGENSPDTGTARSDSLFRALATLLGGVGAFCLFHNGYRSRVVADERVVDRK